ncbi:MAG TPA: MFS transporter [Acidimicrobiales bacterium]|nr:MFS transporter [Acidimicrobiales bacterium]
MRDAFAALLDQRTPFGRLALTHVLSTAGDAFVTISLAGSLFFSISPKAAESRVILYLLLTMTPFAVVAPLLGPVIDRSRGARRAVVVASAAARAGMCFVMANGLHSLLLFPEAFAMLVLSKVYLVTKGALVPLVVAPPTSRRPGAGGTDPVAATSALAQSAPGTVAVGSDGPDEDALATANARLGLLASLAGFAASLPAIGILNLFGGEWVLRLDVVVFLACTVTAVRLPVRRGSGGDWAQSRRHPVAADEPGMAPTLQVPVTGAEVSAGPSEGFDSWARQGPVTALGPRFNTHPEVVLALSAMSVLKGLVGFLTFFLAFSLRRHHTSHVTFWIGLFLAATVAGAIVGVLLVPKARRRIREPQILGLSIWIVAVAGALAAIVGGTLIQTLLAFVIGVAGAAAKPAFDALVQRFVPAAAQGRAFARFETRLQLVWVIGALVGVLVTLPLESGDIVIGAVAAVSGLSYLTSRRALRHRWPGAV